MKFQKLNKSHVWTTYMNPRNQRVKLDACATCGVLKGAASDAGDCRNIATRVTNMLSKQGWVANSIAA